MADVKRIRIAFFFWWKEEDEGIRSCGEVCCAVVCDVCWIWLGAACEGARNGEVSGFEGRVSLSGCFSSVAMVRRGL